MIFTNEYGEPKSLTSVVFPLVQKIDGALHFVATGFFIHAGGGFATARHTLFDRDGKKIIIDDLRAIEYITSEEFYIRPISHFFNNTEGRDICLGMLGDAVNSPKSLKANERLTIRLRPLEIGEEIHTIAYPNSTVVKEEDTSFLGKFRMDHYTGRITRHLPEGRDSFSLPHDCYETSMEIKGGASGGPVLDAKGHVVGVNSRGLDGEGDPVSWITPITEILDIPIPFLENKSIRELKDSAFFNVKQSRHNPTIEHRRFSDRH